MAISSRVKALLQLLALGVPLLAILLAVQYGAAAVFPRVPEELRRTVRVAYYVAASGVMWLAYHQGVRWIERRAAVEVKAAPRHVLIGLAIGFALFAATEGILVALGHARYVGFGGVGHVLPVLAGAWLAAVGEELVFRAVIFRQLGRAFGVPAALVVSSILFGGIHALNPHATVAGIVSIALEAGLLLGLAYALTGSIWLAVGIHWGWNFTESAIFGSIVSGSSGAPPGIFKVALDGPALWTGGSFGPEASLAAVLVCLAASISLALAIAIRRRASSPA